MRSRGAVNRLHIVAAFVLLLLGCVAAPVLAATKSGSPDASAQTAMIDSSRVGGADAHVVGEVEQSPREEAPLPEIVPPATERESEVLVDPTEAERAEAREAQEREQELLKPEAIAERKASQFAYTDIDPAQAENLLRSRFASQLQAIDADPSRALADVSLERVVSPHEALVSVNGEESLLESSVPLQATQEGGALRKVDLGLKQTDAGYAPVNSLVDLSLPETSDGPIQIGDSGLALTAVGAETDEAVRRFGDEDLYLPAVAEGTDVLLSPITAGVEISALILSRNSPEQLTFAVTLPNGDVLRASQDGGAEVIDPEKKEALATISAPQAIDAQGTAIPVSLAVKETSIVLEFPHRSLDVAYPILVDPEVMEENWAGWWDPNQLNYWSWEYKNVPSPETYIGSRAPIVTNWGTGLYLRSRSKTEYPAGSYGRFIYVPQGGTTYIKRAIFGPLDYNWFTCNQGEPHPYVGVWGTNNAWTFALGSRPNASFGWVDTAPAGNLPPWSRTAIVGMSSDSKSELTCGRDYRVGGATMYLDDTEDPSLGTVTGYPTNWTSESPFTINMPVSDGGLGVYKGTVSPQGSPPQTKSAGCTGHITSPCPANYTFQFNLTGKSFDQGEKQVQVSAEDALKKTSGTSEFTMKVDRSGPEIDFGHQLAEATDETNGDENDHTGADALHLPVYDLAIEATDGNPKGEAKDKRSGVKSIEVFLDEEKAPRESWTQSCPTSSCAMTKTFTLKLNELVALQKHTLKILSKDFAGNESKRNIDFKYVPATGIKDEYVMQHFPLFSGEAEEGEEASGPELAVNLVNGNLVYQQKDVEVTGPGADLNVERYYNSLLPEDQNTEWGDGWTLAQTPALELEEPESGPPEEATLVEESGAVESAVQLPTKTGEEEFDSALQATITKEADGYALADESGESSGTVQFSEDGQATGLETGDYAGVEYDYEGDELTEIAVDDPAGAGGLVPPEPPETLVNPVPTYGSAFGSTGTGNGQMSKPGGVAIDASGNLWVADRGNNRLQKFNEKGEWVKTVGAKGSANGQFLAPSSIAFTSSGGFWVADSANNRLQQFNSAAEFVKAVSALGSGFGSLTDPEGIAVDAKGNLWVADSANGRILKLNEKGESPKVINPEGMGAIEPTGIAVGPGGNVWVADWAHGRLVELGEAGNLLRSVGSEGTSNRQFVHPASVAIDSGGRVWVADEGNQRVQELNPNGSYLARFGAAGTGPGKFSYPTGLAVDKKGHLWVADSEGERSAVAGPGPVATYSLDAGSGTTAHDDTGNGHEASLKNGVEWTSAGKYGGALHFDGVNDLLTIPHSSALDFTSAFTLEAWVKPQEENEWSVIFMKERGAGVSYQLHAEGGDDSPFGSVADAGGESEVSGPDALPVGAWSHLALTSDGKHLRLYVDGELAATADSRTAAETSGDLQVGGDVIWGEEDSFKGSIDELRIYGRTLNQTEVESDAGTPIKASARVESWVLSDNTPIYRSSFGATGSGPGQFSHPGGIALDQEGNLLVADVTNNRIEKFNPKGEFLSAFGEFGSGLGKFNRPTGVAVAPNGDIWVVDSLNKRLEHFSSDGKYLSWFPFSGSNAEAIAIDSAGHIWVNSTILVELAPNGQTLQLIGQLGTGPARFKTPNGVAIGPGGNVFVCDSTNNNVQVFAPNGEFRRLFGEVGTGQLKHPDAIAVDGSGTVWVADEGNSRIVAFNQSGEYIGQFGTAGSGPGQVSLSGPMGIATDAAGRIWVADSNNNRVQKWATPSVALGEWEAGFAKRIEEPSVDVETSGGLVESVEGDEAGATEYEHDGDLLTAVDSEVAGETSYDYDAAGHMTKVDLPNGSWAEIAYEATYARVESVTVSIEGAKAKTTYFDYEDQPHRRTTVTPPPPDPVTTYDIGADGSVLQWSDAVEPPELKLAGTLADIAVRETSKPIESGPYNLIVEAHSEHGIASIEVIANGSVQVSEKTCAQIPGPPIECRNEEDEWVTETGSWPPGIVYLEAIVTDALGGEASERFWVNIPYTPPPDPEAEEPPKFADIQHFREEFGLDLDLKGNTSAINDRIFDLMGAWHNPHTPDGEVARATTARWGVPMRSVDAAELEYREWYVAQDGPLIRAWGEANYPNSYSGYYVDHRHGGIIHVGFMGNQTTPLAQLESAPGMVATDDDRFASFDEMPSRSYSELVSLQMAIAVEQASQVGLEGKITGLRVDVENNVVSVGATDVSTVSSALASAYGSGAPYEVHYQPPGEPLYKNTRYNNSGPVYGGQIIAKQVTPEPEDSYLQCTAGFGAEEKVGTKPNGQPRIAPFVLTAGHCYQPGDVIKRILAAPDKDLHSPVRIGVQSNRRWQVLKDHQEFEADGGAIQLDSPELTANRVIAREGALQQIKGAAVAEVGMVVCGSLGKKNAVQCQPIPGPAEIRVGDFEIPYSGPFWEVPLGFYGEPGDSGSPVWSPHNGKAIGLYVYGPAPSLMTPLLPPPLPEKGLYPWLKPERADAPGLLNKPFMGKHLYIAK